MKEENEKGKKKELKKNLDPTMENSTFTISLGRDSRSPFLLHTEEQITTITHQNGTHQ